MSSFWQDLRFGFRTLLKLPGFAAIAVSTLALGMAANTAMFTIANAILLRLLPVRDPGQIVKLATEQKNYPQGIAFSYPEFIDFQSQARPFAEIFFYDITLRGMFADGKAEHFAVSYVSPNFFSVLGIAPAQGRLLLPTEGEKLGADPVLVLGYSYCQKRFGGDPGVVGKQVLVDGAPITVVGVTPKGFYGTYSIIDCQGYMPVSMERAERHFIALARLKPGISVKDPFTYTSVAALLTAVALLACWIPARRATRVDPLIALRYE